MADEQPHEQAQKIYSEVAVVVTEVHGPDADVLSAALAHPEVREDPVLQELIREEHKSIKTAN